MEKFLKQLEDTLGIGVGQITIGTIITDLVLLIVAIIAVKLIVKVIDKGLKKSKIEEGLHNFIESIIKILLWFIVIIVIADQLGIPITSLVALFSVFGLTISLALQGTLSNLASGIMILVTKPFKTGDFIEAAGISGNVLEIRLVYTRLSLPDRIIMVPNSEVASSKIINYTRTGKRRTDIKIGVSYDSKHKDVMKAIDEVLAKNKDKILENPEPFVKLANYGESSIDYVIRVWTKQQDYWDVYFDILENLKPAFDKHNVEITYNHLNVHILDK